MIKALENTVARMTGRSAEEIRQSPLPRLSGKTPPGFISTARVNRNLDRMLKLPDAEELRNLWAILGCLAAIIGMAFLMWAMSGYPSASGN